MKICINQNEWIYWFSIYGLYQWSLYYTYVVEVDDIGFYFYIFNITRMQEQRLSYVYTCAYAKSLSTSGDLDRYYKEELPDVLGAVRRRARNGCGKKLLFERLPILKWMPVYRLSYLPQDFLAGLTVGLTAIPQGIAYAVVGGLRPQYGLYSDFMGSFVYILFGTCKDITIGEHIKDNIKRI